jgi:predicted outer membrane repeat protein
LSDVILGWNTSVGDGGGLFSDDTSTLTNVSMTNNQAEDGGGIYVSNGTTTLVSGCTLSSNTATNGSGVAYKAVAIVTIDYDLNTITDDVTNLDT